MVCVSVTHTWPSLLLSKVSTVPASITTEDGASKSVSAAADDVEKWMRW